MADSTDTSPLFAQDSLDSEAETWPSLFGEQIKTANDDQLVRDSSLSSISAAPHMCRNDSSPGHSSSRSSRQGRHSFTTGVNAKRRDKPLPVINVDPSDVIAVKRARNTMAARKSRQKRVERNDELIAQVADLEKKVDYWKEIALSRGHVE